MHNTTSEQFKDDVVAASRGEPIVVMFHSPTCGPCAGMKPMLENLATEQGFKLVGIDATRAREWVGHFGVRAVPTLIVFDGEEPVAMTAGAKTEPALRSWIAAAGVPKKLRADELVTTTITATEIKAGTLK